MEKLAMLFYLLSFQGPLRMTYSERIWRGRLLAQASGRKLLPYQVEGPESWQGGGVSAGEVGFWRGQD